MNGNEVWQRMLSTDKQAITHIQIDTGLNFRTENTNSSNMWKIKQFNNKMYDTFKSLQKSSLHSLNLW